MQSVMASYLAVRGTDAGYRCSVKNVDSTLILLLSWGSNGHICQFVPVHISQHCQSSPKATPGMALITVEDSFTLPPCSLLNRNSRRPKILATLASHPASSPQAHHSPL